MTFARDMAPLNYSVQFCDLSIEAYDIEFYEAVLKNTLTAKL